MVIVVQGEGLLAILSTDCLGSKSATVPSQGGGMGAVSAPSISHVRPPASALPTALPVKDPCSKSPALGAAVFETVSLRSGGTGAAAFFLPFFSVSRFG